MYKVKFAKKMIRKIDPEVTFFGYGTHVVSAGLDLVAGLVDALAFLLEVVAEVLELGSI
jgi:hypothetical protein